MAKEKNVDMVEEAKDEEKDAEERKRGGAHKRKRGGACKGEMPMGRPDRRARGGATSDKNPLTAAGHTSKPSFVRD